MYHLSIAFQGDMKCSLSEAKERIRIVMAEIFDSYHENLNNFSSEAFIEDDQMHAYEDLVMNSDGIMQVWSDPDGEEAWSEQAGKVD